MNAITYVAKKLRPGDRLRHRTNGSLLVRCLDQWDSHCVNSYTLFSVNSGSLVHASHYIDHDATVRDLFAEWEVTRPLLDGSADPWRARSLAPQPWMTAHPEADVPEWFENFPDVSDPRGAYPYFHVGKYAVCVDYADPEKSEFRDERVSGVDKRFIVHELCFRDDEVDAVDEKVAFQTDDLGELQTWLRAHNPKWRQEHPEAQVPEWFEQFPDESWRNDAMPIFHHPQGVALFVNYADASRRECGDKRYDAVEMLGDDSVNPYGAVLFSTDDLEELKAWLADRGSPAPN